MSDDPPRPTYCCLYAMQSINANLPVIHDPYCTRVVAPLATETQESHD